MGTISRVDVRASIIHNGETNGHKLMLSIRSSSGDFGLLKSFLPGKFVADGRLTDGSLVLILDDEGTHSVSRVGYEDRSPEDHIWLPARFSGIESRFPMAPVTVTATLEHGVVTFDRIDPDSWVRREYQDDPRLARVRDMLSEGRQASDIAMRLTVADQGFLADLLTDRVSHDDVPPHVSLLARKLKA